MMPTPQKQPTEHAVHIHLNGSGLRYARPDSQDAATIHVRKDQLVKWHCDHGNYSVLFKGESPFEEVAVHGRKGAETVAATVTGEPGRYEYAVTVAHVDGTRMDDPIVIIDE
jgi:hypothetical protein